MSISIYDVQAQEIALFQKEIKKLEKSKGEILQELESLRLRKSLYDKIQSQNIESPEGILSPTSQIINDQIGELESKFRMTNGYIDDCSIHIDALMEVMNYF